RRSVAPAYAGFGAALRHRTAAPGNACDDYDRHLAAAPGNACDDYDRHLAAAPGNACDNDDDRHLAAASSDACNHDYDRRLAAAPSYTGDHHYAVGGDARADEDGLTGVVWLGCLHGGGPVCSGAGATPAGDKCPKKGDVAKKDCHKALMSYADADQCVAPVDAQCVKIKTGAWGCVFSSAPSPAATPASTTPRVTPAATKTTSPVVPPTSV
ncbi:hypothetical protein PybrP1_000312, partial [[Pythium] brassicae (nom. inval.)]